MAVGEAALAVDTCWVVASAGMVVAAGCGDRDGVLVAFVGEAGGAVVSAMLGTCGGVTTFLLVVARIPALDMSAGDFMVVEVVSPDVTKVIAAVDVSGRTEESVVDETRTLV